MLEKVTLIVGHFLPILHIVAEIHLLGGPEARDGLLVHVPDIGIVNRHQDEAILILAEDGLVIVGIMLAIEAVAVEQFDLHV